MGTVYEALDQRVSAIVALKETIVGDDEDARRAFEREAALLANLHHQALPKVMDYFIEDGGEFLVMEYISGYDLAELLEVRGSPFDVQHVLGWADELLKVLDYLHGRKPPILHRDIKPSNLKLTKQGEIFLLDFGLAKGAAGQMPTLVTSRSVRGYTPLYASLEQMYGKRTDTRSDLYSLGATLYHLLTNVPPVDAPTRFETLEDEETDPLRPAHEINPQVHPAISSVIQQAMAISRKNRPASATEMRFALQRAKEEAQRATEARLHLEVEQRQHEKEERARVKTEEQERNEADAARRRAEEAALRLTDLRKREEEEARQREEAEAERLRLEEENRQRAEEERLEEEERQRRALAETERREAEEEAARKLAAEEAAAREEEAARRLEEERRAREEEEEARRRDAAAEADRRRAEEERRHVEREQQLAREAEEERRRTAELEREQQDAETVTAIAEEPLRHAPSTNAAQTPAAQSQGAPDSRTPVVARIEKAMRFSTDRRVIIGALAGVVLVVGIIATVLMRLIDTGETSSANGNQAVSVPPGKEGQTTSDNAETAGTPTPPAGMVYVPGGTFWMGRDEKDGGDEYERPAHQVTVNPFFIDIYEVTNEEYAKFVSAKNHRPPSTWSDENYPANDARKPVTGVTWNDANEYANWVGKRLPTEEEWEYAARGADGRLYPWGPKWLAGWANANGASRRLVDVGTYKGASPFGAFDMVGNAWEWTASTLKAYSADSKLPEATSDDKKVIRGGNYISTKKEATSTYRMGLLPINDPTGYNTTGFRCIKNIDKSQ